ncbi:MAG TPA: Gfo/Idh/MocA family oxidoreductase [Sporichthyaceae bacterium]|nr:Gfo/Idh/MocA family oxidoreductase [Sporichthyaceae bacterium]
MSVQLGVLGFGKLGRIHAEHVATSERARLVAVCDSNPEALRSAQDRYGVRATADLAEFLAGDFDGVVIASPTPLHPEHIRAVARAGKAIFTEKPVGLSLTHTDQVLAEVDAAGVVFQIGFQRRWDERYRLVKKVIDSGDIGDPVLLKAHGRDPDASNPANWGLDRNGGLFLNCAIHDYDVARYLLGREVEAVGATGGALVHKALAERGDLDTCFTTLFFGEQAIAHTEWSRYAAYGYDVALEVVGTRGIVHFGRDQDRTVLVRDIRGGLTVFDVFADAYRRSIEAFASAIADSTEVTPGIGDARTALQIALTARESCASGGARMAIPELPDLRLLAPVGDSGLRGS